ncbi:MAG: hypothetical protein CTY25_03610 [Methylobacterium sp.]|nr:MAG: hypothetical protein CTY25_03610 [Methylobacterium sp.]
MEWVFCFDEKSSSWFADMIKVAVLSAETHTRLRPVCLYDGQQETAVVAWLRARGVRVISATVPFRAELESAETIRANEGTPFTPEHAAGAYLRLCAVDHVEGARCLYTDCDVMFLGDPLDLLPEPGLLAAAPELVAGPEGYRPVSAFNSGVLLFDCAAFRARRDSVVAHARAQHFYSRRTHSFDQTLLNEALRDDWEPLDPRLNWRPFQGMNPDARILHFHGPKPHRVAQILGGEGDAAEREAFLPLIGPQREAYQHYIALHEAFLARAE